MTEHPRTEHPKPQDPKVSGIGAITGIVSLVAVVLMLLVAAFAWPAARSEPAGLTVAVAGESKLVDSFLAGAGGLAEVVDLERVGDRAEAVTGVERREYIGGIVLAEGAPEVLVATAGGQVPEGIMTGITARLQSELGAQLYAGLRGAVERSPVPAAALGQLPEAIPVVAVTDIAPYSDGDPRGAGATVAGIPLSVGALLAGILIAFTVRGRWQRLTAVLGFGAVGGLFLATILGPWLEVYPGPFGVVWAALGLSLAATSGLFVGLNALLGRLGFGVAALITLFAAMPLAAFGVPFTFLPAGLGSLGQWLIPGATVTLARNVSYFPEAATTQSWWALTLWLALAVVLALVSPAGAKPGRARARVGAPE